MSGVLNKIKEAVTGGHSDTTTTGSSTTHNTTTGTGAYSSSGNAPHTQGPHNTDAANRADPRVDSDGDGRAGYEVGDNYRGTTGSTGTMGSGVGHPDTGIGKNTTSTPLFGSKDGNHLGHSESDEIRNYEAKHGHTAGLANLERSAGSETAHHHGSTTGTGLGSSTGSSTLGGTAAGLGTSSYTSHSGTTGSGVSYGQNTTSGTSGIGSTTTSGPHSSNIANKLDPRVDSDRDGSRTVGTGTGVGTGSSTYGSSIGGSEAGYPHTQSGLHAADVLSELKPGTTTESHVHHRHNLYMSDNIEDYQTGSGVHTKGTPLYGYNDPYASNTSTTGTGLTGGSGLTGSSGTTGLTGSGTNTGYGSNTTSGSGPHASGIANKLDPRVDSDNDGSRLH